MQIPSAKKRAQQPQTSENNGFRRDGKTLIPRLKA
jgi:hypothetical protein